MPVDQLQELIEYVQSLESRIKTLETSPSQQNMTVDKGATRILSDEGLQVGEPGSSTGSEIVYGTLTIFGKIDGDGTFEWSGGWRFDSGDGEIAGDVALTGDFDLTGLFKSGNVRIQDGKIYVGAPGSEIVLDGAAGSVTVPGSIPIVLRQVGGLARIDLGATAQIWSGGDGVTILATSGGFINVYSDGVDIGGAGKRTRISNAFEVASLSTTPPGVTPLPMYWDPVSKRVYAG